MDRAHKLLKREVDKVKNCNEKISNRQLLNAYNKAQKFFKIPPFMKHDDDQSEEIDMTPAKKQKVEHQYGYIIESVKMNMNIFKDIEDDIYGASLLFKAKRDGFTPKVFHEKCDNKGPTLIIA